MADDRRTVLVRAVHSAIVEGPEGVIAFCQANAGKYAQLEVLDQAIVMLKPKAGPQVGPARMVQGPDGRPGVTVQQEVVPVILVTLLGTVAVAREAMTKEAEASPVDRGDGVA